jgi:hypothetical protein
MRCRRKENKLEEAGGATGVQAGSGVWLAGSMVDAWLGMGSACSPQFCIRIPISISISLHARKIIEPRDGLGRTRAVEKFDANLLD